MISVRMWEKGLPIRVPKIDTVLREPGRSEINSLSQLAIIVHRPRYTAGDCPGEIVSVKATDPRASENAPSGGKKPKCKRGGGQAFGIIAAAHSIQVNRDFERVTNQLHMRKEREERRKRQEMMRDRTEVKTGQLDEVELW